MVLGRQVTNEDGQGFMEAVELTEDHKPDNAIECRRIMEAGGRVDRLVSGVCLRNCCKLCPQKCRIAADLSISKSSY